MDDLGRNLSDVWQIYTMYQLQYVMMYEIL